jgi:KDO2-lipid IV(A) lauroyltransferase
MRLGGRWTLSQAVKNHLIYAAVRVVLALLRPLPASWIEAAGRLVGRVAYRAAGASRRIALGNLALVYPALSANERRTLARRNFRQLGAYLGETVAQLVRPARFVPMALEPGSLAVLEAARGSGRGVLFVSAHLGPWEQVAGSLVHHGFSLTTVAREAYDPRLTGLYDGLRSQRGVRSIYRGSPSASLHIAHALRSGCLLGVLMDLSSRVPSIDSPFLGIPAPTAVGPARLALRVGASVVVGTVAPRLDVAVVDPRYVARPLVLRVSPVDTSDLEPGEVGEGELTRRINEVLASRIRGFPEGWVWMHPRWAPRRRENSAPPARETRYTPAFSGLGPTEAELLRRTDDA